MHLEIEEDNHLIDSNLGFKRYPSFVPSAMTSFPKELISLEIQLALSLFRDVFEFKYFPSTWMTLHTSGCYHQL